MAAMFSMAFSANAQYNVEGHKFFDNWSIGVEGGVTTNLHDWNTPNGAVFGINLTKAVTPVVSFEIGVGAGVNNNYNWLRLKSPNVIDNLNAILSTRVLPASSRFRLVPVSVTSVGSSPASGLVVLTTTT